MIDFREIQVYDNNFDLNQTVIQNEDLTKKNNQLIYLLATSALIIISVSLYLSHQNSKENPKIKED